MRRSLHAPTPTLHHHPVPTLAGPGLGPLNQASKAYFSTRSLRAKPRVASTLMQPLYLPEANAPA